MSLPPPLPSSAGTERLVQRQNAGVLTVRGRDRYPAHPEPAPAKAGVLLGHKKLGTTALYTHVAVSALGQVTSPLDFRLKMPG